MKTTSIFFAGSAIVMVSACSTNVQTTSGADYLARYDAYDTTGVSRSDLDAEIREIAAIEPHLQFPARIGLARIDRGQLATVPEEEGYIWASLAEDLGPDIGVFAPVSPLIIAMVDNDASQDCKTRYACQPGTQELIADIRRGAARQHLDYVLVYEVGTRREERANALALADLTIIGMFVLPSRDVEIDASASAILIDVRNGYPYATLTAHAEKDGVARAVSSGSRTRTLSEDATLRAVELLSDEVHSAFDQLIEASQPPAVIAIDTVDSSG